MQILRKLLFQLLLFALLIGNEQIACAQKPPSNEYQIKAVFLFHFCQFTEWPEDAFASPDAPIVIAIYGKDPFGSFLDETIAGEKVNGRPLTVRRLKKDEGAENCHILFINQNEPNAIRQVLKSTKGKSILTISDANNFINFGGMIRFVKVNNKIQFQINAEETKAHRLQISSKVLNLAEIVNPQKKDR